MNRVLPRALREGDEIALLAPASGIADRVALDAGLERLRSWGFVPVLMPHARGRLDWPEGGTLAATDEERLADLQEALANPRYRAVICVRGGYGAGRLLEDIDWSPLAKDPKPLVGYSDITALLAAARAETGVVGFHGPMCATVESMDAGEAGWALQRQLLTDPGNAAVLPEVSSTWGMCAGEAEGPLVGGNLCLVQSLIGTKWAIDTAGALLFLEDTGEAPYRVDRFLTHLLQVGALERAAGVILGDFHVDDTPLGSEQSAMLAVLEERLARLSIPVARGFPIGHLPGSWTLPCGVRARLRVPAVGAASSLELLEPAVRS